MGQGTRVGEFQSGGCKHRTYGDRCTDGYNKFGTDIYLSDQWTARALKVASCPSAVVEDAEDLNNQILQLEGRGGYWFAFKDDEGSTIEPAGNGFKPSAGGANASKYAARVSGKLAPSGYSVYAGVGFSLDPDGSTYDASKYKGISFMARTNETIVVRFKTPDVNTKPEGGRCKDCYNDFGVDLEVTPQWAHYTILFSDMSQQRGWGDAAPGVATDALFAIQWQLGKKTGRTNYGLMTSNSSAVTRS